jgi:hypothetical protein
MGFEINPTKQNIDAHYRNNGETVVGSTQPNSIYTVPQPEVQSVAESGSTNVTETLSNQPLTISETFYGYNIDDLRKFLLKPENPSVGNCRGDFFWIVLLTNAKNNAIFAKKSHA